MLREDIHVMRQIHSILMVVFPFAVFSEATAGSSAFQVELPEPSAQVSRATAIPPAESAPEPPVDLLGLGDPSSEAAHGLKEERSEILRGGLGQPARRLLAGGPFPWEGGSLSWTMKVDPAAQNYLTVKLWGSDKGHDVGRLILFAEGLQVGYRHEGDHDFLNQSDDEPLAAGRFVHVTVPLPPKLTEGKSRIGLKISCTGPIWFYGPTFDKYQKPFTGPSRGIYRAYTHTAPRFVPDASEARGNAPDKPFRRTHGPEVIDQSKQVVIDRLRRMLGEDTLPGNLKSRNEQLLLLAEAYQTPWTPAHRDRRALARIVRIGDAMAAGFRTDPKPVEQEWSGAGALGQALMLTWPDIALELERDSVPPGETAARRSAWTALLRHSLDFWRANRRSFTNQSMIVDAGIYTANRGLRLLDPARALPEEQALGYLHESAGIRPWLGSDLPDGRRAEPYGRSHSLVSRKGLSRELGYVGAYGETILPFARDMAVLTGDPALREQVRRMQRARHFFRYPSQDADGHPCMKLVSEIDNRTAHYPYNGAAYNAPDVREAWWMETAALLTDDPLILGVARQSVEEGQYFRHIAGRLKDRDTLGMMRNVSQWETFSKLPPSAARLPMSPGMPDFVFSDEENAVLAIKRGDQSIFINFYYRAERAVNRVARVFEVTPELTRLATVRTGVEVIESGSTYTRPDWIDRVRSRGITPPGQNLRQAWAGEVMPISKRPDDATSPAYGEWGPFVGQAAFHHLRYGDLLIGVNTTADRSYPLPLPSGLATAPDLVSGKTLPLTSPVIVPPLSTVVLDLKKAERPRAGP